MKQRTTKTNKFELALPWVTYKCMLNAMFGKDPEIEILSNDEEPEIKLVVKNDIKASALRKLMPESKMFGNVKLTINIESHAKATDIGLLNEAFQGNPILDSLESYDTPFGSIDFAVFKKEVVQFYNDEWGDLNGLKSTLYEDIAREIFPDMNVRFCTNPE